MYVTVDIIIIQLILLGVLGHSKELGDSAGSCGPFQEREKSGEREGGSGRRWGGEGEKEKRDASLSFTLLRHTGLSPPRHALSPFSPDLPVAGSIQMLPLKEAMSAYSALHHSPVFSALITPILT